MNNSIVCSNYYENKLLEVCNYYENKKNHIVNSLKNDEIVSNECNIPMNATNFMESMKENVLIQPPTIKSSKKKEKYWILKLIHQILVMHLQVLTVL